jgi:hypothetical protein
MATRYSGDLKITIKLQSDSITYNVTLESQDHSVKFVPVKGIKLSQYAQSRIAADSKEAFDEIARVAISFAADDFGDEVLNWTRMSDEGEILIQRRYAGNNVAERGLCGVPESAGG